MFDSFSGSIVAVFWFSYFGKILLTLVFYVYGFYNFRGYFSEYLKEINGRRQGLVDNIMGKATPESERELPDSGRAFRKHRE